MSKNPNQKSEVSQKTPVSKTSATPKVEDSNKGTPNTQVAVQPRKKIQDTIIECLLVVKDKKTPEGLTIGLSNNEILEIVKKAHPGCKTSIA